MTPGEWWFGAVVTGHHRQPVTAARYLMTSLPFSVFMPQAKATSIFAGVKTIETGSFNGSAFLTFSPEVSLGCESLFSTTDA